jgi:hypothetical protein
MGMKTFDEVGNVGFSKSWQEENKDLLLEFKAGDVREVRFVNAFLPMALHWVPFIKKGTGKVRFFPQMCLRWDLDKSLMSDELECPACDREVHAGESGVFWVIDVEALFLGDKNRALKIFEIGSRERKKLANLAKFNKVQGTPQQMGHSKYGRVVQVSYDPNNSDPSLRWSFSKGDRLPVKLLNDGTVLKVKIPENADSDYAGKVFSFELQDLMEIVIPPSLSDTKQKFKRMKVDEAVDRLNEEDDKKKKDDGDDDDDGGGRRRRGSSPRRRSRDDDDDDGDRKPRNRRRRPSRDDDDADPEDDFGDDDGGDDGDGDGDDEPRQRRGNKRQQRGNKRQRRKPKPKDDDDDWGDDDGDGGGGDDDSGSDDDFGDDDGGDGGDDEPRQRRGNKRGNKREGRRGNKREGRRRRRRDEDEDGGDDEDSGPACNNKAARGDKCAKHKGCYGHIGEEDTEDCTICKHRDECMDLNADDGYDDD